MTDLNLQLLIEKIKQSLHGSITDQKIENCVHVTSQKHGLSEEDTVKELLDQYSLRNYLSVIPSAWLDPSASGTSRRDFLKMWNRDDRVKTIPIPESSGFFRVCTFNVHYWFRPDDLMVYFQEMLKDIESIDADVVCIQEAVLPQNMKAGTIIQSYKKYEVDVIGPFEKLGYIYHIGCDTRNSYQFGLDPTKAFFGNAVFSKHPIILNKQLALESYVEGRCMALAEIDLHGIIVNVASIHLDVFDNTEKVRERQIKATVKFLEDIKGPLIIAGDFNALWDKDYTPSEWKWLERNNQDYPLQSLVPPVMIEAGFKEAFDTGRLKSTVWTARRVDYVWFRGNLEPMMANVFYTSSSDHHPLVVDFVVG